MRHWRVPVLGLIAVVAHLLLSTPHPDPAPPRPPAIPVQQQVAPQDDDIYDVSAARYRLQSDKVLEAAGVLHTGQAVS